MQRLRQLLLRHEGIQLHPYKDTRGKTTIGVGRCLDDVGISEFEAMMLLNNDIDRVIVQSAKLPWFNSLCLARQDVVNSMIFNLGLGGFLEFKNMIAAMVAGNFDLAADEMTSSKWASQVGARAQELATMMKTGRYPA